MAGGFALPTVIIASVILLTILVTSVTAVGSVTSSLANQYYNQLAREAAESGLATARACLRYYDYSPTWTDATPLKPNTGCAGEDASPISAYIINANNIRTTFSVPAPEVGVSSSLRIVSTGKVELTRASDPNQVWRTFTYVAAENTRYNDTPQIAGGAGWKTSQGHNGYMLASTGVLYGWGDNGGGQLGDASLGTTIPTPIKMALPDGVSRAQKVFNSGQGASIVCIIATHSSLGNQAYCRGTGGFLSGTGWQRIGLTTGLTATDMVVNGYGTDSACVIASDNQAYCIGNNDFGQLGLGTTSTSTVSINSPTKFRLDLASPGPVSGSASSLTVKKIYNQDVFTCVIASDNQAYCAGWNIWGNLGQGTQTTNIAGVSKSIPGRAVVPGSPSIVDIRLPYHYSGPSPVGIFFQVSDGTVYMSGNNGEGTANDGATSGSCPGAGSYNCYPTPRLMTSGNYPKMISVGEGGDPQHSFCIIQDNSVAITNSGLWCIGSNSFGQLGTGDCNVRSGWWGASPLGTPTTERATSSLNLEANYQMNSVMVITTLGNVYAAGDNTYGKLGRGTSGTACNNTFAKVQLPAGVKAVALANGDEYSAFILGDNGKVYAMGRNNYGQLGDGTTTNRSAPVEVKIPRQETIY